MHSLVWIALLVVQPAEEHARLAQSAAGSGRFDGAVDALLTAIGVAPEVEQPYVFLGRILEHAGARMPEVVTASAAWAERNPRSAAAQLAWGKALAASGDAGKAGPVLERAVAIEPSNGEALYELGAVRESKKDFAGAAKTFERAAAVQPKSSLPHYRLSRVYARLGLADRAARERALHEKLAAAEKAEIDARQAAARKLELTVK